MWKRCFNSTIKYIIRFFIVEANSGLTVQLVHAKSFPCIIMVKIGVHCNLCIIDERIHIHVKSSWLEGCNCLCWLRTVLKEHLVLPMIASMQSKSLCNKQESWVP
ncbi:hypothetical protein ACB098_01G218900 [Castanea mollissima]